MSEYYNFEGRFTPTITEDLPEAIKKYIGKRISFTKTFIIDQPPYEGDTACWTDELRGWIPESDISDIVGID